MPNQPPSIYIFHGEDEIAVAEHLAHMREQLGEAGTADLNTTRLEARGLTLAALRDVCLCVPFISRRRLVIVVGYLAALVSRPSTGDTAGEEVDAPEGRRRMLEEFLALLDEVPASTALVLVERSSLSPKHPVLKWAAEQGDRVLVRSFAPPPSAGLPAWIRRRAEGAGGEFTLEAAQELAVLVGEDLPQLQQEVEKLLTYVNRAHPVRREEVLSLTPEGAETNVFEMVDAVGARNSSRAVRLLHKLLEEKDPLYALAMITRQMRLLLVVREALEAQTPRRHMAEKLRELHLRETEGVRDFVAEKLADQAGRFSIPVLEAIYFQLRDLDEAIKVGQVDPAIALEVLVASWCVP